MPERYEEEIQVSEESAYVENDYEPAPAYGPSTVIAALDQIDILVENARAVPLSANVVLNKAEIVDLVGQARDALPEDLVAADAVVADADAVLDRADSAAEAAIGEANAKARSLLEDARERADSILSEARDEAARALERAQEEASHTAARAKKEAEDLLADANAQAERLISADSITALSRSRAEELMIKSRKEAEKLREGADNYVSHTLGQTSEVLKDLLRRTEAGLRAVSDRHTSENVDISIDE